ncbi:hypothetical protein P12x_003283 [Tundrisphaera lichenicola]|uniref:hypothetical protein n=1 Tax=Tundrisphaera lichenicola TaxID=2029860 RepID=UPI003EBC5C6D
MTCVDFDRLWNELLDARQVGPSDLERELEGHAASCAGCRSISTRYQVLRHAVGSIGPAPIPSAESTARLLQRMEAARSSSTRPARPSRILTRSAWASLAAAAAVFGIVRWMGTSGPGPVDPPISIVATERHRPFDSALADATSASIELAREASAPAARIGREVLSDLEAPQDESKSRSVPGGFPPVPASALLSVGERLQASVRPISGSARHAFGFLLGPPPAPDRL